MGRAGGGVGEPQGETVKPGSTEGPSWTPCLAPLGRWPTLAPPTTWGAWSLTLFEGSRLEARAAQGVQHGPGRPGAQVHSAGQGLRVGRPPGLGGHLGLACSARPPLFFPIALPVPAGLICPPPAGSPCECEAEGLRGKVSRPPSAPLLFIISVPNTSGWHSRHGIWLVTLLLTAEISVRQSRPRLHG